MDALYLNPVTAGHFGERFTREDLGYASIDLQRVEPTYGTLEQFRALVREAHARGLRVVLDFINLGFSREHPRFQAAVADRRHPDRKLFMLRERKPEGEWLAFGEGAKGWYPLPDGSTYYSLFGGAERGGLGPDPRRRDGQGRRAGASLC